jgi:hypothetical protein
MNTGLILLTTLLATARLAMAQLSCSGDFTACAAPLDVSLEPCTGAYKKAFECAAKLFNNTECQADADVLFLSGGVIGLHAGCMMLCGTSEQCPFDGAPQYLAAVNKVTLISRTEVKCLVDLINCQSSWNKCTASACTCTEGGIACSNVAAAPCPDFGDRKNGIPAVMTNVCKQVDKCTVAQCNNAAVASAPIALVAAISALFFAVGN